ncbi:MAG: type II toxin-antitoxin system VapC family toxin [Chloroflexi bacterium]|nr:type II toxin-antitoxin system VapC family toxin [Chloroflexota bacterium]MCI0647894.1 type II toxin-antitoxin system VapC family toxin [Chloroflexota bacterium]MCI0727145.1 type II toxin-antitoxin system VapC family toxin [Chloroflexota bacterium]
MPVIDASVYLALINDSEAEHGRAWEWFKTARRNGETIFAPSLLLAEVAGAISRGLANPILARRTVQQLLDDRLIKLAPVANTLAQRAALIAADHRVCGCDAVYLALAEQLAEPLVTLDRQQLERGAAVTPTRQP